MRRKMTNWTSVIVLCSFFAHISSVEVSTSKTDVAKPAIQQSGVDFEPISLFVTPVSSSRSDFHTFSEFSSSDFSITTVESIDTAIEIDSSQTNAKTDVESSLYKASIESRSKTRSFDVVSTSELEPSSAFAFPSSVTMRADGRTNDLTETEETIVPNLPTTTTAFVSQSTTSGHNVNANVSSAFAAIPHRSSSVSITASKLLIPTCVAVLALLVLIVFATAYRLQQRGRRRRKVYLSHREAPPKDFAEDTAVRGPVLLPEEIEMQTNRATSFRVQRAIVLATDSIEPKEDERDDAVRTVAESECQTATTPSPPPYRIPPPYLMDTVIENVHAL